MTMTIAGLYAEWKDSQAAERSHKDTFVNDLCDALGVPRPRPIKEGPAKDDYVFEKDALLTHEGGKVTVGKIDVYKAGAFILEAKQGSNKGAKKIGTARRDTPAWNVAMNEAYGQALGYARTLPEPVPFLITCDIGYCFDLYACFDGSREYRPFPNPQASRIHLKDLGAHQDTLRRVFVDPLSLDPSRRAAKVTREVATHLAALARNLEKAGHPQAAVATFLMRCLFTMFAEDVGLLPERLFTDAVEKYWKPNPPSFVGGIESLWRTMNDGGHVFGAASKILRFNGGLFAEPTALPLDAEGLGLLLEAALCNWAEVEPAIFGTLLERALDPKERHALGAHYTPRAYVERLVRPTIEEPLRADWEVVLVEVRHLVAKAEEAKNDKARKAKIKEAVAVTRAFQRKLCSIRVLDPACGSGNFLYVTLDLFKRLEAEVLAQLEQLGEKQTLLHMEGIRVTPEQFHGIEKKRWAKEIAELVLWIGYLQWHFRMYGRNLPVPEPVLRDYKNIEHRDAVLAYDREELVLDEKGKPVTRWDGETMKVSPVTGEKVPDEGARVPIYRYVNPRKAEWPQADFVVGNPPFIGTKRMIAALGEGYVGALRATYSAEVEDNADLVMYWWEKAAKLLDEDKIRAFGLITTNSITQTFNRRVVQRHLETGTRLVWAIPDHPWSDSETGAAVRIAMTCASRDASRTAALVRLVHERPDPESGDGSAYIEFASHVGGVLHGDLRMGANVASATALRANSGITGNGVALHGRGFVLSPAEAGKLKQGMEDRSVRPYLGGRDLLQARRERYLIDFSFLSEEAARASNPSAFQRVMDLVLPERRLNRRDSIRTLWWRYGWERPLVRRALEGLPRYIGTTETARHRVFQFIDGEVLSDHKIVVLATDDALHLGVASSRPHVAWALAAGSRLGVGNDPVYVKTRCFDPYPFPTCTDLQAQRIRDLAEALDAHRKARQAAHPALTITGMYNVLTKLRAGEALTDKDKVIHEQGLVSILKKLHDDLDAAVFDAYGWPADLTDEQILERLVALNAERAEEEKRGLVRWLRPEFQAPQQAAPAGEDEAEEGEGEGDGEAPAAVAAQAAAWPKKLPEQVAAVRDLLRRPGTAWSLGEATGAFKGAKEAEVEPVLESLAALGLVLGYETRRGRRWKAAAPAA